MNNTNEVNQATSLIGHTFWPIMALIAVLVLACVCTIFYRIYQANLESSAAERRGERDPTVLSELASAIGGWGDDWTYLVDQIDIGVLDSSWVAQNAASFSPSFLANRDGVPELMLARLEYEEPSDLVLDVIKCLPEEHPARLIALEYFTALENATYTASNKLTVTWFGGSDRRSPRLRVSAPDREGDLSLEELTAVQVVRGELVIDGTPVAVRPLLSEADLEALRPLVRRVGLYLSERVGREHERTEAVARAGATRHSSATTLALAALGGGMVGAALARDD